MTQNGQAPFPDGTLKVDESHVTNALLQAVLQAAQAGSSAQDTREMGEASKAALGFAQAVVILDPGLSGAGEPLDHQIALGACPRGERAAAGEGTRGGADAREGRSAVKPTRLTQPYRKGARVPGQALTAMLKGRAANGTNPADVKRAGYLMAAGRRKRATRPPRPPRPVR
jgi:hypothetical protein